MFVLRSSNGVLSDVWRWVGGFVLRKNWIYNQGLYVIVCDPKIIKYKRGSIQGVKQYKADSDL